MERLTESTMGEAGLEPLCRLIRFERSPLLSKEGAFMILAEPEPEAAVWPRRARVITAALEGSSRPASKWLMAYAQFQTDPEAALAEWDKLVADELAVSEPLAAQDETRIQTLLLRKQAEMLLARKHDDQALAVMRKMIEREADDTDSLTEFVSWLAKNKAWSVVDEVSKRYERTFNTSPKLLYTLAQACKTRGNVELAEQFALKAYRLGAESDDARTLPARFTTAYWLELPAWPIGPTRISLRDQARRCDKPGRRRGPDFAFRDAARRRSRRTGRRGAAGACRSDAQER